MNKCKPCSGTDTPMDIELSTKKLKDLNSWEITDNGKKIKKDFKFKDFVTTLSFVNKVGNISEENGHHPDIYFTWGKCTIKIYTHKINGLHENDFILAKNIDNIKK